MYVASIHHSNYSRLESKKHNLHFLFLTLGPWNKVKVIKPTMKMSTLSKGIIIQNLKDLVFTVSEKKATLKIFSNEKIVGYFPWTCAKKKKGKKVMYVGCTWHNQQLYKVLIYSRSLKVVWMGKAQRVLSSCKVWPLYL